MEGHGKGQQMALGGTLWMSGRAKLVKQNVDPDDYPFVYLVTSPRLLNYKYSPASFWFLYSEDRKLTAMIAEVNNTFNERRMYFLQEKDPSDSLNGSHDGTANGAEKSRKDGYFRHNWPKDFHVSPFNSRKGSYVLKARNPVQQSADGRKRKEEIIDITASLLSSKEHVKLVTRLSSTGVPLDPSRMSSLEVLLFLLSWWWVGLMTC